MRKAGVLSILFLVVLLAVAVISEAQQAGKVARIGILAPGSTATPDSARYDSFRQGLRELGYIEGKTYSLRFDMQKGSKIGFLILLANWLSSR